MMNLNQAQKQAIQYNDGPLLIVAGAGTGKTTVITEKIAYLIDHGLTQPEQILALTFTEKAAKEMEERVDRLTDIGYSDIHISTFHAFCQNLLENYGMDIGLPNRFKLLTETDAWLMMREHLDRFDLSYYRPLGNPIRHIHELLKHFSKCKDELITPAEYLDYAEGAQLDNDDVHTTDRSRLIEIASAYYVYNQVLLDNMMLDFGDLIFYSVKLLQERPAIRQQLHTQFTHILVDEFQDVNYAQYELVKLLAGDTDEEGINPQLTVVGDDDQSIYAFRGASVSNILQFKEDFTRAKEIVLTENFRSGQTILDHAYQLIQHNNPDRLEIKLHIDKRLIAYESGLAVVQHVHQATGEDEVQFVIEEIQRLLKDIPGAAWDDFAILARANSHAEPFMDALARAGMPYEFLTSSGLYRQPIVIDCFHILKAIVDYHNDLTIYHLLRFPMWQFNEHDVVQFTRRAKQKSISYYEALKRARELHFPELFITAAEKLVTLLDRAVTREKEDKPTTVLLQFLEESGYLGHLIEQEAQGDNDTIRAIRHLQQFFTCIDRYQVTSVSNHVSGFVQYLEHLLVAGDEGALYQPTDTPESVNILTVHAAKGLEFRFVFIINCVEQRFPSMRRRDAIELPTALIKQRLPDGDYHEQEERRLFYVGMTRAKERLYLMSADYYDGAKRAKKASRFVAEAKCLLEAPPTLGEQKKSHWPRAAAARNKTHSAYILPETFSFSQIRAFLVCPYQYKLAHLLQIPARQSHYFSFGNTLHTTLQSFYERMQLINGAKQASLFSEVAAPAAKKSGIVAPPLDTLLALYDEHWIPDWYQSKQQRESYYKKGKDMLRGFYATHEAVWTIPLALEKGFKIKLDEYHVTGKIDRVDVLPDSSLHIIDYKTGETKEEVTGSDKDQLLLYQLAALRLPFFRHIGQPSRLTYYYLNDGVETSFLGTEKELAAFEAKMIATISNILLTDWSSIDKNDACGRCEFCQASAFRR